MGSTEHVVDGNRAGGALTDRLAVEGHLVFVAWLQARGAANFELNIAAATVQMSCGGHVAVLARAGHAMYIVAHISEGNYCLWACFI